MIPVSISDAYTALPLEIRNKLTKDLLANPGQIGQDLMNFLGPKVQNLMQNLSKFSSFSTESGTLLIMVVTTRRKYHMA